jgi:serine/threonine protein kinase
VQLQVSHSLQKATEFLQFDPRSLAFPSQYEIDFDTSLGAPGWWGISFPAKNKYDQRPCALKLIRHPFSKHQHELQRELANLVSLPLHYNLIQYHTCFLVGDLLCIEMELIYGRQLGDIVDGPNSVCFISNFIDSPSLIFISALGFRYYALGSPDIFRTCPHAFHENDSPRFTHGKHND